MNTPDDSPSSLAPLPSEALASAPKPFRWLMVVPSLAGIFLLGLLFARSINPQSFALHPERSVRRAAVITLALMAISILGRALSRPGEPRG